MQGVTHRKGCRLDRGRFKPGLRHPIRADWGATKALTLSEAAESPATSSTRAGAICFGETARGVAAAWVLGV